MGNGCFWNGHYGAGRGGRGLGRRQLNWSGHAISVDVMPQWTLEYSVFAYDSFVKSGELLIETQWLFHCCFNIGRHGNIPSRNTILRWVTSFRTRGMIMKNHLVQSQLHKPRRTWKEWEWQSWSPTRSARRHAVKLGMSKSTVRLILHKDLGFHP